MENSLSYLDTLLLLWHFISVGMNFMNYEKKIKELLLIFFLSINEHEYIYKPE